MAGLYTPDATNTAQPDDSDYLFLAASELRTLKAYLAAQLVGLGGPVNASVLRNKNLIINGNFSIWQRANSQTTNGYGSADRWAMGNNGTTKTASRQSFAVGQTAVDNNPKYYLRHVVTSVAGVSNYCIVTQKIEDVTLTAGKQVTISFYAKADAAKNIAIELYQSFGTGGAPSADVSNIGTTTIALTTAWQKFQVTVTLPSVSGKVLGSNGDDYLGIIFWLDAGTSYAARTNSLGQQSGTFDIAQVQVEFGGYATPFEYRHPSQELILCQRYYEVAADASSSPLFISDVTTATSYSYAVRFSVIKRAAPTVGIVPSSASRFNNVAGTITASIDGFRESRTSIATGARGYFLSTWTADAEL